MTVLASTILAEVAILAQDPDHIRWPLPEAIGWLNDGLLETVLQKPSAYSRTVVLSLVAGTLQGIGSDGLQLLRLTRNITDVGPPVVGGRMIRVVERQILDLQSPDWNNPAITPPTQAVKGLIIDEQDPKVFWVFPPNNGTGMVEAILAKVPPMIVATGDATDIASYATAIPLEDVYKGPLISYILSRFYSKDSSFAANMQLATAHYGLFQAGLGVKVTVETTLSPNAAAKIVTS